MSTPIQHLAREKFSFTSSIAADTWHRKVTPDAFEWWYFDALSDDGRDAVVIIFLDNFVFSPRYNRFGRKHKKLERKREKGIWIDEETFVKAGNGQFPAVVFIYYRDGKPTYRAINEFPPESFASSEEKPECRIGENFFRLESAPYGSGYVLSIDVVLSRKRRLKAQFEWLSIEGDFLPERTVNVENSHSWNLVLSRADVSGRVVVDDEKGKNLDTLHFRGTGYHDHNIDNRWLPDTVAEWQWGRAHFNDTTAVFYRYKEINDQEPISKLLITRDTELHEYNAGYEEQNPSRDIFGVRYPQRMTFNTPDGSRLRIKQLKTIDASFFYLRFLSEMTLTLRDGTPRKTTGITEYLAPKALKYGWLDWLVNMRIGRNGKGSLLP